MNMNAEIRLLEDKLIAYEIRRTKERIRPLVRKELDAFINTKEFKYKSAGSCVKT